MATILNRYPVRNENWTFVQETGACVIEASQFEHLVRTGSLTDPWNRPLDSNLRNWKTQYGPCEDEADVTWIKNTTVDGTVVQLIILND